MLVCSYPWPTKLNASLGAGLIGSHIVRAFLAAGCNVSVVDLAPGSPASLPESSHLLYISGDISKTIGPAFDAAEAKFGTVETCVAMASLDLSVLPQTESICDMDPDTWRRVMDVNVTGTFLTARRWLQGIRSAVGSGQKLKNVGLVIMGSESGTFGVRTMAAYAAGKSAVQAGLMLSLSQDAPRIFPRARVNAVAPGAVDTPRFREEMETYGAEWTYREAEATVGLARPVNGEEVARVVLGLASERWSSGVHGKVLGVDAGKMGVVLWSRDERGGRIEK